VSGSAQPWRGGIGLHGPTDEIDDEALGRLIGAWRQAPCTVLVLESPSGSTLSVWADGAYAYLEHMDADERVLSAFDPSGGDERVDFHFYQGDTPVCARAELLTRDGAVEVLREFFATETLSESVEWRPP
jgi:hypothetical protein